MSQFPASFIAEMSSLEPYLKHNDVRLEFGDSYFEAVSTITGSSVIVQYKNDATHVSQVNSVMTLCSPRGGHLDSSRSPSVSDFVNACLCWPPMFMHTDSLSNAIQKVRDDVPKFHKIGVELETCLVNSNSDRHLSTVWRTPILVRRNSWLASSLGTVFINLFLLDNEIRLLLKETWGSFTEPRPRTFYLLDSAGKTVMSIYWDVTGMNTIPSSYLLTITRNGQSHRFSIGPGSGLELERVIVSFLSDLSLKDGEHHLITARASMLGSPVILGKWAAYSDKAEYLIEAASRS